MINTAFIKIWGETIGAVAWDENTKLASFEFDPAFLAKKQDLSPIRMPISTGNQIFSFPELRNTTTFNGLPGLLADSLPDRYGNQLIDAWLAQQGRPANSMNPVEKLCFIGTRGMGALEFQPAHFKTAKNTFSVEVESLIKLSKKILQQRSGFETKLDEGEQQAMKDILRIGTSAGGMRAKAIIAFNEKTNQVRSGQTRVPKGFEHWLIKLDGVNDEQLGDPKGYGRIEMAYHLMAKDCEIEMTQCRLLEENDRAHFMTKRFDREGSEVKHHIQTFCAMQHYDYNEVRSYSYEQLYQTMRILRLPYPQAEQMFRRMVFNVLAQNCDDHTKNTAFRLKENGQWELAPAYDVSYAYRASSKWVSQHALSINGKRENITKHDLLTVADSMNIKKAGQTIKQISQIIQGWPQYAEQTKVESQKRDAITTTLVSMS